MATRFIVRNTTSSIEFNTVVRDQLHDTHEIVNRPVREAICDAHFKMVRAPSSTTLRRFAKALIHQLSSYSDRDHSLHRLHTDDYSIIAARTVHMQRVYKMSWDAIHASGVNAWQYTCVMIPGYNGEAVSEYRWQGVIRKTRNMRMKIARTRT
ncbi:hypothetical protein PENSPDRAFT_144670 [Peniophora sp. CONT]|nr:hypothetical protein PENSPDRAFT_144670 [Peniophora sp. CONT]